MLQGIEMRPDRLVPTTPAASWIFGTAPGIGSPRLRVLPRLPGVPSRYGADGFGWLRRARGLGRGRSCRPLE